MNTYQELTDYCNKILKDNNLNYILEVVPYGSDDEIYNATLIRPFAQIAFSKDWFKISIEVRRAVLGHEMGHLFDKEFLIALREFSADLKALKLGTSKLGLIKGFFILMKNRRSINDWFKLDLNKHPGYVHRIMNVLLAF